jgi:ureidoglycolate hydrolase
MFPQPRHDAAHGTDTFVPLEQRRQLIVAAELRKTRRQQITDALIVRLG